jgi:hypothetical protein
MTMPTYVSSLMFVLCAACSLPTESNRTAADATTHDYVTQITAPAPNYRALLDQPTIADERPHQRPATSRPPPDAKAIGDEWIARLTTRHALLGYGLAGKNPVGPVDRIDVGLTKDEFERWALDNNWQVPSHISWSFVPRMILPRISDAAKDSIRVWPASTARTGAQNQALFNGRLELRDGCFFVGELGKPVDKLAWFHSEMGFDIDAAGYFILRDRVSGQVLARLGEDVTWGGPASAQIDKVTERALKQACGAGEIYIIGSPQASERFWTQHSNLRP